jgi:OOP family OmpA-OmpF porin
MAKISNLLLATLALATLIPSTGQGATPDVQNKGYLVDGSGNFVENGTGLCWHTGQWSRATPSEPCDPVPKVAVVVIPVAPVAKAAAPEPVAPPPVVAKPTKISFSGDMLFTFDKSELRPRGRELLDDLVRQLEDAASSTIVITGHADRIGRDSYNQALSERRAQAVKDYLVGKNIAASRIQAMGKGETEPVTKPDECKGAKSAKVIACLQPDRRVDVEMTGTTTTTTTVAP